MSMTVLKRASKMSARCLCSSVITVCMVSKYRASSTPGRSRGNRMVSASVHPHDYDDVNIPYKTFCKLTAM